MLCLGTSSERMRASLWTEVGVGDIYMKNVNTIYMVFWIISVGTKLFPILMESSKDQLSLSFSNTKWNLVQNYHNIGHARGLSSYPKEFSVVGLPKDRWVDITTYYCVSYKEQCFTKQNMDNLLAYYLFLMNHPFLFVLFFMCARDLSLKALGIEGTGNYKCIAGIITCHTMCHIPAKFVFFTREVGLGN
jgi:hypothetical protein